MLGVEHYVFQGTVTAAAGTASVTITPPGDALIRKLYAESATATTTFDFKMTDRFSLDTWEEIDATGFVNDVTPEPVYGNFTITISNASVDENFSYLIVLQTRNG